MSRVRVKICGVTRPADAIVAADAGADAVGMIFWPGSRRAIDIETARAIAAALPPFVARVGVFVDQPADDVDRIAAEVPLDVLQFHGGEAPGWCASRGDRGVPRVVKAFRVKTAADIEAIDAYRDCAAAFLLDAWDPDAPGGTGHAFDWELLRGRAAARPVILAGGLTPDNVAGAIRIARPWGVDVSSGVESAPGVKDHDRVREFVNRCVAT